MPGRTKRRTKNALPSSCFAPNSYSFALFVECARAADSVKWAGPPVLREFGKIAELPIAIGNSVLGDVLDMSAAAQGGARVWTAVNPSR